MSLDKTKWAVLAAVASIAILSGAPCAAQSQTPITDLMLADAQTEPVSGGPGQLAQAAEIQVALGSVAPQLGFPAGFWCQDTFRVAGAEMGNFLNRLCGSSPPSGGPGARAVATGGVVPTPPASPPGNPPNEQCTQLLFSMRSDVSGGTNGQTVITGTSNFALSGFGGRGASMASSYSAGLAR